MSFYRHYTKRKDHRKPYYDSRRFDTSCRNHGSCGWCRDGRTFHNERRKPIVEPEYEGLVS